jgi:hypothetical protein
LPVMRYSKTDGAALPAAIVLAILLLCSMPSGTYAWDNGGYSSNPSNPDYGMHDRIADLALSISTEDVAFLRSTYHTQYLLGTEAPDNPEYIGDSVNHHVYFYSSGEVQDDKSAARAKQMYEEALAKIDSGSLMDAAFLIGAMTHYISDVGVFGHTMGSATDWGAEVHHSDYESEFDNRMDAYSLPSSIAPAPKNAYEATMQLARTITFGEGVIKANIWMDSHYNWSDLASFVPSAMHSLDLSILAVASAIDQLVVEVSYTPPDNPTGPADETPTPGDNPPANTFFVGLTMAAVIAVSGILLAMTRRRR